ncbi:NADH dehydrogenase [ubiquinone] 1 alpha subcomplex subunit 6 isoform 1-T1 [Cyanocitta cristata]
MAVAGKGVVSAAVKPIFSRDLGEAKRRVRELYRAWYREVPNTVHLYQLDITVKQGRNKVREMFMKNAHVTDPRVIDMLVIKVQIAIPELLKLQRITSLDWKMVFFADSETRSTASVVGGKLVLGGRTLQFCNTSVAWCYRPERPVCFKAIISTPGFKMCLSNSN